MSKTPYEIRADLLTMASNHLREQYIANMEFSRTILEKTLEQTRLAQDGMTPEEMKAWFESMQEQMKTAIPKVPTIEEVLAEAAKLYGFVGKKD